MSMKFEYRFNVGMSSVDAAGVMFFPELLRHAHDAYEAFMKSLGHDLPSVLARGQHLLPIRHAEADYRHPMGLGTELFVRVGVSRIGRTSFTIVCRFIDGNEKLCADANTVHVCIDPATGQPVALPKEMSKALQAHRVEPGD